MSTERIKVAIRIRPFLPNEDSSNKSLKLIPEDENTIILYKEPEIFQGTFNRIFSTDSTQKEVFSFIKPCLFNIEKGINCTILAYGQTGTGKTYTMFGGDWSFNEDNYKNMIINSKNENEKDELLKNQIIIDKNNEYNGIIPNLIMELYNIFSKNNKGENNSENKNNIIITCSYIQIYNEKIYDLLDISSEDSTYQQNNTLPSLKIKTDKKNGLFIEGANEIRASSYYDIFDILEAGESKRKIRQTYKNTMSSRSHTIFMINIEDNITHFKSKIKLCDLAGSERYNNSNIYKKEHLYEMKNINKSLFTLGNVINALAKKKKYIPYKDSKLTRILEDSLRGNSSIYLIATISPGAKNIDETFHTLKFADRAHSIMIRITPNHLSLNSINNNIENYDFADGYKKNREVEKLKDELSSLKQLIYIKENKNSLNNIQEQFLYLKKENNQLRKSLKEINNINGFKNIIRENKKLKRELNDLKLDYFNLRNELFLNKKLMNANNPLSHKPMKNSLSQGNIFLNKINIKYENIAKKKKEKLKKIENDNKSNIQEISTDKINKKNRDELIEIFKYNKLQKSRPKLKHISSKINVINPKFINKNNYELKDELKCNKIILSSLRRLQIINSLELTKNNLFEQPLNLNTKAE